MESWRYMFLQLFLFCILEVSFHLDIDFKKNINGVLGKNNTKLECSLKREEREEINVVTFLVENETSGSIIQVAQFRPEKQSRLLSGGNYLANRSILSNLTMEMSTAASITFQPLKCIDEAVYKCRVTYFKTNGEEDIKLLSANLSATVDPSEPNMELDKSSVEEGDNITFICRGNVGKPPHTFAWQKFNGNNVYTYKNVSTKPNNATDSCFNNGTSELITKVTHEDDNAEIKCSIGPHHETTVLDVKYKVRTPSIKREPEEDEYLQGSNYIKLICAGEGNPQPSFTWSKDWNMNDTEILSRSNELFITDVFTNNSGVYICNASNTVFGTEYSALATVNITIVIEKRTTTSTATKSSESTSDSNQEAYIIVGIIIGAAVLVIIICAIIGYFVCRRNRKNSYEGNVRFQKGHTPRNNSGYESVNENLCQNTYNGGQSHNNQSFNPDDTEKANENVNKGNDTPGLGTGNEYASVNESTKLKNRTTNSKELANQQKPNEDDTEDPYAESKDNTYAHLNERHPHKNGDNAELFDKTGDQQDRL